MMGDALLEQLPFRASMLLFGMCTGLS